MRSNKILGTVFATVWILGILVLGASLPGFTPAEKKLVDGPIEFPPVSKPESLQDQKETVKIIKVARGMKVDYEWLTKQYEKLPPFNPNRDRHLTTDDIDKFLLAYYSYRDEIENFTNNTVGQNPGLYQVIAIYGMIFDFHVVVQKRALVAANLTEEEFDWIQTRIMEAGLFAVMTSLDQKLYDSEAQQDHFVALRERMYWTIGAAEPVEGVKDGGTIYHLERYQAETIPQGNIKLFLDRYREVNWAGIHFHRPTTIEFNREVILKAAANNPP